MLGEQLPPHVHMPILDSGQLAVQIGATRIVLGIREFTIEVRRVSLVFEVVEPVSGGAWHGSGCHAGS